MTKEPMSEHKSTIAEMTKDSRDQQKSMGYAMSLSSEVDMTNCYKHCEHFFDRCKSIHFNVLIGYWMMAGYLGPVHSIEEAYKRGHEILLHLTYEKGSMLKPLVDYPEMVEFVTLTNSELIPCSKHQGLCITEDLGFVDLLDLDQLGKDVVLTDGMLKTVPKDTEDEQSTTRDTTTTSTNQPTKPSNSVLLIDGSHLSRQVFHPPKKLKYLACFDPRPDSLNRLLNKVRRQLSVLLIRDCEKLREIDDLPIEKFKDLTVLEISGLSQVTDVPSILLDNVSKMRKLKCLNISGLLIKELPSEFFSILEELEWVILRGCSKLVSLPTIKPLKKLKMLDLSHCSALLKIKTTALQNSHLQMLDLSYTSMSGIPTLKDTLQLTHLFSRDSKVSVLNSLKLLRNLKVLDLSGAGKVKEIHQFKDNKNIIVLNLSRTTIKAISFLSDMIDLRNLILQGCTFLEELPAMKKLTNLEVLDLSGCEKLHRLPEDLSTLKNMKELNVSGCSILELREGLFDQMSCLVNLDLSRTKTQVLPSFSNLASLCKLSLRGLQLSSLESLASLSTLSLSTLEELDLSGLQVIPPQKPKFDFIESLEQLQILNLSQTSVSQLPDLSNLKSLRKLILADCQQLEVVPDLRTLTNLEILDLSLPDGASSNKCPTEIEIECQRAGQLFPSSCRQLMLKNRFGVQKLFPLASHVKLEYLDFRGTDVEKFPYESMNQVKCFQLPAKIDLSGVRISRRGDLQEEIDWKGNPNGHLQGKTLDVTEIQISSAIGNKSFMLAGANKQFFHLMEKGNQGSWEAFIHQFVVSLPHTESNDKVSLPHTENNDNVTYLDGDEFILRDNLSWARRLLNLDSEGKSVEIHGFSEAPDGIRNILQQTDVDNVAFVANDYLCSISNLFSRVLNVCCIRRCHKMKSVLSGEKEKGVNTKCPKRLVLSDLVALESIYAAEVSPDSIESLKHLHIDCCPNLTEVITASLVPKQLETLQMKFCDKIQTLFEKNISLSNLKSLNLFELSKLEGIEADLPSLQTLSISQCPKMKNLDRVIQSASLSLTQLCLASCHIMEHALPSSPLLEKLQVLKISSCKELVTLISNTGPSRSSLPKLQTIRLWSLPKLKSIGVDLSLVPTSYLDPSLPPSITQQ